MDNDKEDDLRDTQELGSGEAMDSSVQKEASRLGRLVKQACSLGLIRNKHMVQAIGPYEQEGFDIPHERWSPHRHEGHRHRQV